MPKLETTLDQYSKILTAPGSDGLPRIIVGGQAVNFWADRYAEKDRTLTAYRPFTSKDLDLIGTSTDLELLAKVAEAQPMRGRNQVHAAMAGYFEFPLDTGEKGKVDILKRIRGPSTGEVEEHAVELPFNSLNIRIIDPITLLQAKTENAAFIKQDEPEAERHDERHMRIMMIVTNVYLKEAIQEIGKEVTARDVLIPHQKVLNIAISEAGQEVVQKYGINWKEVFPVVEMKSHEPLKNFAAKRLLQFQHELNGREGLKILKNLRHRGRDSDI